MLVEPFNPRVKDGILCSAVVLTFEYADETLWCDQSKEMSLTAFN